MTKTKFIGIFNEIRYAISAYWLMFCKIVALRMDGLRLSFAIFMCDSLQRANNKRFYVIRNSRDRLVWVCNDDIDMMRRPRRVRKIINGKLRTFKVSMLPKHISHLDIMKQCLYYTPSSRNNTDGLSQAERYERRKNWLNYMERIRLNRLYGKLKAKKKTYKG